MKYLVFPFLFLLMFTLFPALAQETIAEDYGSLALLTPRAEGSLNEERTMRYILSRLQDLAIPSVLRDFSSMEGGHSFSGTIEATLSGEGENTFILAIPLNGASVNLAAGLSFLDKIKKNPPPLTVKVLFLGAESEDMGSGEFLREYTDEGGTVCYYLGFTHPPERVLIRPGSNEELAPYWLIQRTSEAIEKTGLFSLIMGNEIQLYRLGLSDSNPPTRLYLSAGYPALYFESSPNKISPPQISSWIEGFTDFLAAFAEENSGEFNEQWDRHYLFFQARGFSLVIPETIYIILLLAAIAILIGAALIFQKNMIKYVSSIVRHIWALPVFYIMIFFFLITSGGVLFLLSNAKGYPGIWRELPLLLFGLKIFLSLFLLFLSFRFLKTLPLPLQGHFYSASAILILGVSIVIMAVYNLSLAYYFTWACFFASLFSLSSNKFLKLLFFLVSPFWLIKAAVDILALPSLTAVQHIITTDIRGNLLLAIIVLPFVLMIIRLDFIFRHLLWSKRWLIITFLFIVLGSGSAGIIIYTLTYNPWELESQPITAEDHLYPENGERILTLSSPAEIGILDISGKGFNRKIISGDTREVITSPIIPEIVEIDYQWSNFLNRKTVSVVITSSGSPGKVELSITSDKNVILYDADFPYTLFPTQNSAVIHIGRNPPNPLSVTFTIPETLNINIDLKIYYDTPPYPLEITGDNIAVTKRTVLHKEIPIVTEGEE